MQNGDQRLIGSSGFSVTEAAIILTVMSILSGLAAPAVNDYVEQAKMVKARSDVKTIGVTLVRLLADVGAPGMRHWSSYDLLVGPGTIPAVGRPDGAGWAAAESDTVGHLDDHLVTNAAGYAAADAPRPAWRGAYLQDRMTTDPWGARYAVNIAAMAQPFADTVALSAGADGRVDTPFSFDGAAAGGDDLTAVVSSSGSLR